MKFASGFVALAALASNANAALQQISNWGQNPGGMTLHAYIPNNVASSPAVILAVRICSHLVMMCRSLTLTSFTRAVAPANNMLPRLGTASSRNNTASSSSSLAQPKTQTAGMLPRRDH